MLAGSWGTVLALLQPGAPIKAFGDGIGRIPLVRPVRRRLKNVAGSRAGFDYGTCNMLGIVPTGLILVRPDQDLLAGQGREVGFLDGRVGAAHQGGGTESLVNQRLRTFLALNQNDLIASGDARQVVQGADRRHGFDAAYDVAGAKSLAGRRVKAIDASQQASVS